MATRGQATMGLAPDLGVAQPALLVVQGSSPIRSPLGHISTGCQPKVLMMTVGIFTAVSVMARTCR